jgi:hypothetical protein
MLILLKEVNVGIDFSFVFYEHHIMPKHDFYDYINDYIFV